MGGLYGIPTRELEVKQEVKMAINGLFDYYKEKIGKYALNCSLRVYEAVCHERHVTRYLFQ